MPNQSKIFLDYAHTPDALKRHTIFKRTFSKKITVIFGCGGERDKSKRRLMGKVAKKYCDKIYVTDDNPRSENPKKIRKDIMKGLKNSIAKDIGNRKKAIIYALKNSDPHEVILIAGKGHETYQDFGDRKIFLSDKNIVKSLQKKNISSNKKSNDSKYNGEILKRTLKTKKKLFL